MAVFRLHICDTWSEYSTKGFKLSGEAKTFLENYKDIVPTLCTENKTMKLVEQIIALFDLISLPKEENFG